MGMPAGASEQRSRRQTRAGRRTPLDGAPRRRKALPAAPAPLPIPPPARGLYTIDELAGFLALHPATIRRWISQGAITALRIGSGQRPRIRIAASETRKLID